MKKQTIGIIGLGKMGGNMALQAMDKGFKVVGYDLHKNAELQKHGLLQAPSVDEMILSLSAPKIIFYLCSGWGSYR